MPSRRYQYDAPRPGRLGRTLSEVAEDGTRRAVLHLPDGLPPEVYGDVWQLAGRTYEDGRHDRGSELPAEPPQAAARPVAPGPLWSPAERWAGGPEEARRRKDALRLGGTIAGLGLDDIHVHDEPCGPGYVHEHDGGRESHVHPHPAGCERCEPAIQDLGAAWDGGAVMARAVLGPESAAPGGRDHAQEHVHVQRIRYVHSHDRGAAEHGHPNGNRSES